MSRLRKLIAERLVEVKKMTASLTTCKEVDMSAVINLRQQYRDMFQEALQREAGVHVVLRQGGRRIAEDSAS